MYQPYANSWVARAKWFELFCKVVRSNGLSLWLMCPGTCTCVWSTHAHLDRQEGMWPVQLHMKVWTQFERHDTQTPSIAGAWYPLFSSTSDVSRWYPWCIPGLAESNVNCTKFTTCVRSCLLPVLQPFNYINPHSVVILDNASSTRDIRHNLRWSRCSIVFLPPYSPDLNPLEEVFRR